MEDTIEQKVIDFTAAYTSVGPSSINPSTTLASLGIITEQDTVEYIMELENSFGLTYEAGDVNGIVTVGDVIVFIANKLG